LTVTTVVETVVFAANGGVGVMPAESESSPTALSLNAFTRPHHTFVDWNTLANGTGVSYANGAVYPFVASATLYAQWKSGRAPSRTITFLANGGTGSMPAEVDNTPTAISPNHFHRAGYIFVAWNTSPKGSGKRFSPGVTYPFKKSVTLYAQWKKSEPPIRVVTFMANGGTGKMSAEHGTGPKRLTTNRFTRHGYDFEGWNTAPNGFGVKYSNGAVYGFSASTNLFAQWRKTQKAAPAPPIKGGIVVGPFAAKTATLTGTLKTQIENLAEDVKLKGEGSSQIALMGYGDVLTGTSSANQAAVSLNINLGRKRAQSVATYLGQLLSELGLKGWTISIQAASEGTPSQSVVATVS
jgi:uncharacterized repeat protein (TIGR02543 family)